MRDDDNPTVPGDSVPGASLRSLIAGQNDWRRKYLALSGTVGALNFTRDPSALSLAATRIRDLQLTSRNIGLHQTGALAGLARSQGHFNNLKAIPLVGSILRDFQGVILANSEIRRSYERSFRRPQFEENARLISEFHRNSAASLAGRRISDLAKFGNLIQSIDRPFLSSLEPDQSLQSIARLQSIGDAISRADGFDDETSAELRGELGDWRDDSSLPESIADDSALRLEVYVSKGLDSDLVDFPEQTFEEIAERVGLRPSAPIVEMSFEDPFPHAPQDGLLDSESLRVMRETFSTLLRFEIALRAFIDQRMSDHYGKHWHSSGILHPDVLSSWETKKAQAAKEDPGQASSPLISFADFTDYERVICKRDIWKNVFEPVFKRQDNIRESLHRLNPVRKAVMHARVVNQADLLYVWAEVNRIIRAIR